MLETEVWNNSLQDVEWRSAVLVRGEVCISLSCRGLPTRQHVLSAHLTRTHAHVCTCPSRQTLIFRDFSLYSEEGRVLGARWSKKKKKSKKEHAR